MVVENKKGSKIYKGTRRHPPRRRSWILFHVLRSHKGTCRRLDWLPANIVPLDQLATCSSVAKVVPWNISASGAYRFDASHATLPPTAPLYGEVSDHVS